MIDVSLELLFGLSSFTYLFFIVIVKASSGPRYVVGCRTKLNKDELKPGTRVTLDMTTHTIMRILPREVDPIVYNMLNEDPGDVPYSSIGGLTEQIRELREVCFINAFCLSVFNYVLGHRIAINKP